MTGASWTTQVCLDCDTRLKLGHDALCDGSGVIAITDWPESRVAVCPAWPCDQPEPVAYYDAIEGLGYDQMPDTIQQRIRTNVMDAIASEVNYSMAVDVQQMKDRAYIALAFIMCAFIIGFAWLS